jgi:hypothetical protein
MANLQLQAILNVIDRATAPLRQIAGGSQRMAEQLKTARQALRQLQQQTITGQTSIASLILPKNGLSSKCA